MRSLCIISYNCMCIYSYLKIQFNVKIYIESYEVDWATLGAQMVKNPPAMQETWVRSLGQEDPLKREMTTHSSILAWEIPWTEELGRLQSMGSQRVGHD